MGNEKPTIFSAILGVIVLALVIQWAIENPQQAKETIDALCGIEDKLASIIDTLESINPDAYDDRTKRIYNSLLSGNTVSDCDMWYFYNQLDDNNRKKLKWNEFACNANDCLNQ